MNYKKMLLGGILTVFIGAQCSGATNSLLNRELLEAAENGRASGVQALLDKKADIEATSECKNWSFCWTGGDTALHLAASGGHVKTVSTLLRAKACIDKPSCSDRQTPLHKAAFWGGNRVVRLLLDNGAFIDAIDENHETALHGAVRGRCPDTVSTLLAARACVDKIDKGGSTALHNAAGKGLDDIVQLLINNGASIEAITGSGRTALCQAVHKFKFEVVSILIDAQYRALIKRCPAIINMGNGNIENQVQVVLPSEVLDLIINDFSPHEIANFRSVCKYFRVVAGKLFENVRGLRAVQLKSKLIHHFGSALGKAAERSYYSLAHWNLDKYNVGIKVLEAELENANKLEIEGLLQGKIICDGTSRFCMSESKTDWSQHPCVIL